MKLPEDPVKRHGLIRDVVRDCEVDRPERRELHRKLRTLYLNGRDQSESAIYNRIMEFVDTSSSYSYDPEGTRFVVETGAQYGDEFYEEEEAASEYLQGLWIRRHALTAAQVVEWAHVYPSMIAKTFAGRRGGGDFMVLDDPADLSVWRPDLPTLKGQEVMVHHLTMDLPSLDRYLESLPSIGTGMRRDLMAVASDYTTRIGGNTVLAPTQNRLVVVAMTPNMIGAAQAPPMVSMAVARSNAPVVELAEAYVWDDDVNDYRVTLLFRPSEQVLLERANPQPGIDIFHKLTLFPTTGYIWGLSIIERMAALQIVRDEFFEAVRRNTKLNLDPPRAYLGVSGMTEEKANRLRTPGSEFHNASPGGEIKDLAPPMPPDAWTLIDGTDRMFDRMGGLPPGADVAAQMSNVRAGNQMEALNELGSPRVRKRAMYVEANLNSVATSLLRLERQADVPLVKPTSKAKFQLAQMPAEITASVAAHSASPLYAERTFERALLVYDRSAIDDETLVTLSGLPMQSRLRAKARIIQGAKAENAKTAVGMKQEELDIKAAKAEADIRKSRRP